MRAYEQALSFNDTSSRRASKRYKTNSSSTGTYANNCDISKINSNSITSNENELKHRIHLCYIELHEFSEARAVLERIPAGERDIKILVSLADLYQQERNNERAREVYLEVLKQDPLRMDLIIEICKLGGCELSSVLNLIPDDLKKNYSWYANWIQAQFCLYSPNSKQAIRLFETLTSRFERRAPILTNLAEAYYHDGNFREAVRIFQIAYNSDPLTIAGVGSYAACLHKEQLKGVLADLATTMSLKCSVEGEHFHEPWLVLAHYYASIDKKEPKALLFVQKAYKLDRNSIETLVLIACLCLEKKDPSKALPYIMTAQTQAPYRYEVQRIFCDAFLANNKKAAALNYAKAAVKSLGETARSYYLWADIMLKSQVQRRKNSARNCLEKAVKLDPYYLPTVFAYSQMLIEEKKFDRAIEILKQAATEHSLNVKINKYLYTCYNEKKDSNRALHYQTLASEMTSKGDTYENLNSMGPGSEDTDRDTERDVEREVAEMLGLEADEFVDHGDSEADDANLDS